MTIKDNLKSLYEEMPDQVKLVAVSKTKPPEMIKEAYDVGQKIFGENKVQEMAAKNEQLPGDIEWHMVGHLQTNKVKYIAPFVSLIHSVDSFKLLKTIDKEAKKNQRLISCLLQVHIAKEETKYGFAAEEIKEILNSEEYKELSHIKIIGLMGMATFTEDMEWVRDEFKYLADLKNNLKNDYFEKENHFKVLSMGMSNDYHVAIEEGSTMVRIGSLIFGARNYH